MNTISHSLNFSDMLLFCEEILPKVSRSFAIGIQSLKGKLKTDILIGYLLCRIADTIEDDPILESDKKVFYLTLFIRCFDHKEPMENFVFLSAQLKGDTNHIKLVEKTAYVFHIFSNLSQKSQKILKRWVLEMAQGMIYFIQKYPSGIKIQNAFEYKQYCYYVAGTVGSMLTDLWKEYGKGLKPHNIKIMQQFSGNFGEGLQSINILKDSHEDKNNNCVFIPGGEQNKESILELIDQTHSNLKNAVQYVEQIPKINFRIRLFCIFPLLMAFATLIEIKKSYSCNRIQSIKISRQETKKIYKKSFIASVSNRFLRRFCEIS